VPAITKIIGDMNSIKKKTISDMKEEINIFFQDLIDELINKFNQTIVKMVTEIPEIPEISKIEPRTVIKVVSVTKFVSFTEKNLMLVLDNRRSKIFEEIRQDCENQNIALECTKVQNGINVSCKYMVKESDVERHSCALLAGWLFCEEAIEKGGKTISIAHYTFLQDFIDAKLWIDMNQSDPYDILQKYCKTRNFILHISPLSADYDINLSLIST
jgi:hypothetical protein